jgi:hypothetical protein
MLSLRVRQVLTGALFDTALGYRCCVYGLRLKAHVYEYAAENGDTGNAAEFWPQRPFAMSAQCPDYPRERIFAQVDLALFLDGKLDVAAF